MKIRITYYGDKGTIYSVVEDYDAVEIGTWEYPFTGAAIGFFECLIQSDECPSVFHTREYICKIKVEFVIDVEYIDIMSLKDDE